MATVTKTVYNSGKRWYPDVNRKSLAKFYFHFFFFRWWTFHYIILFFLNHQSPKRKLKKNVQIIENEKISQTKWRNEGCRVISSFRSQHISFVLTVSAVNILVEDFWTLFWRKLCFQAKINVTKLRLIFSFSSCFTDCWVFSVVSPWMRQSVFII